MRPFEYGFWSGLHSTRVFFTPAWIILGLVWLGHLVIITGILHVLLGIALWFMPKLILQQAGLKPLTLKDVWSK